MDKVWTIGYGNSTKEDFLSYLKNQKIDVLIDCRNKPYSRWQSWTNKVDFQEFLLDNGIGYENDTLLGGLYPQTPEVINTQFDKLFSKYSNKRIVLMCSELDPDKCHRKMLLAPILKERGVQVEHILKMGIKLDMNELFDF